MSFGSLAEFLAMGGHGLYVWLSYGATLLVVVLNAAWVLVSRRRAFREAADRMHRHSPATPPVPQTTQETESSSL